MVSNGLPRPHKLYVYEAGEATQDENGFIQEPAGEWVYWCNCRDQPHGQSREFKNENGDSYYYSSTVFVDLGTKFIQTGARIKVVGVNGHTRLSGEVKRFSTDMAHARIWV